MEMILRGPTFGINLLDRGHWGAPIRSSSTRAESDLMEPPIEIPPAPPGSLGTVLHPAWILAITILGVTVLAMGAANNSIFLDFFPGLLSNAFAL